MQTSRGNKNTRKAQIGIFLLQKIITLTLKSFGKVIAQLRREKSWTQEFLSQQSKLSMGYISRVELGKQNISLESIRYIAQALDVPVSEIFKRAETLEKEEYSEH